ncbi:MAG: tRNA (adenosine(37)-N6)-threonylcarbamoyltransferase complex transferase subunit TsaD [Chloroflexi bacterium]|nr:tRNA (adenosine(37)-N6)-threonylcarbamoyltransferase complex transferase subunit TsaD [Chloroflexota bacterium]
MADRLYVLGIETSCDETAAAVVSDGRWVRSNVVASQVPIHARYGGVVPEVASRQHILAGTPVIQEALERARVDFGDLGAVAVTFGPGLAGALLVGVNMAKAIALAHRLPLVGVNHLEGHLYANWLIPPDVLPPDPPRFPVLCLIVSGGHSDLLIMRDHGIYRRLGRTRDDAAGEAFDKVARLLGLGYPGGPAIQRAAAGGNPEAFALPRAWLRGTHDFSFSGLKTAVLRVVEEWRRQGKGELPVRDLAASFQWAVVDVLVAKTVEASEQYGVTEVMLAGGVAANELLRREMIHRSRLPVRLPPPEYCTDNAAMVAAAGYYHVQTGRIAGLDLDVVPTLPLA